MRITAMKIATTEGHNFPTGRDLPVLGAESDGIHLKRESGAEVGLSRSYPSRYKYLNAMDDRHHEWL